MRISDWSADVCSSDLTANRAYKAHPRQFVSASGMHYRSADGREILDGTAGLWCCNAGHCRPEIAEAIAKTAAMLDFAPTFQLGHPLAFELAQDRKSTRLNSSH